MADGERITKEGRAIVKDLWQEVPELCRPHRRELDGRRTKGCPKMAAILVSNATECTAGWVSYQEIFSQVRLNPTCDDCPLNPDRVSG